MPTYNFRNTITGVVTELSMSMANHTQYLLDHPDEETIILNAPFVGDPASLGTLRPPSDFLKYIRDPIIARNRGASPSRYVTPREI